MIENNQNNSDNFESLDELNDSNFDSGISLTNKLRNTAINRNAWARTSFKRLVAERPDYLTRRKWDSCRLQKNRQISNSNLARSVSFNSSSCESTGDPTEDMNLDESIDEQFDDLNDKVQELEEKVEHLESSASTSDESTVRIRNENYVLKHAVHNLEETIRDAKQTHEKEMQQKSDFCEKQLNRLKQEWEMKLETFNRNKMIVEKELSELKTQCERLETENCNLKSENEHLRNETELVQKRFDKTKRDFNSNQSMKSRLIDENTKLKHMLNETKDTVRELESSETIAKNELIALNSKVRDLTQELDHCIQKNHALSADNNKLQETLLVQTKLFTKENSLENELKTIETTENEACDDESDEDVYNADGTVHADKLLAKYKEVQKSSSELQFVNTQLKNYIEYILLTIVEKSPNLLEVRRAK